MAWLLTRLARLRIIMALAALLMMIAGVKFFNPITTSRVMYDYMLWASSILAILAASADLWVYRDKGIVSTLFFEILGLFLVVYGRLCSLLMNITYGGIGFFEPLLGSSYSLSSFLVSLQALTGSIIISGSIIGHVIFKGPPVLANSPSIADLSTLLYSFALKIDGLFSSKTWIPLIILALVGFTYRFIPEIYYWPNLIGWDTPEYVAHLLDFATTLNPFTSYYWMGGMRNTPPMINIVLLPAALAGYAWEAFKLYPSIAFGFITVLGALIAVKIYGASWRVGFLAGLATMGSILVLRISWDYQKQLLGTVFMLACIIVLEKWSPLQSLKRAVIVTAFFLSSALSSEITALASWLLSVVLLLDGLKYRDLHSVIAGLTGVAASTALEIWYWRQPYIVAPGIGVLPVGIVPFTGDYSEVASYIISGYGLILPPALIVLFSERRKFIGVTVLGLMLAGASPLIAPYTSVTTWYRFLIAPAPIVAPLSVLGFSRALHGTRNAFPAILLYLILSDLMGYGFVYAYPLTARYVYSLREFPSALTPSAPYVSIYEFFKGYKTNTTIVAQADIARYVHMAIRNPSPTKLIWSSSFPDNSTVCSLAKALNLSRILVVTRVNLSSTGVECANGVVLLFSKEAMVFEVSINTSQVWK